MRERAHVCVRGGGGGTEGFFLSFRTMLGSNSKPLVLQTFFCPPAPSLSHTVPNIEAVKICAPIYVDREKDGSSAVCVCVCVFDSAEKRQWVCRRTDAKRNCCNYDSFYGAERGNERVAAEASLETRRDEGHVWEQSEQRQGCGVMCHVKGEKNGALCYGGREERGRKIGTGKTRDVTSTGVK